MGLQKNYLLKNEFNKVSVHPFQRVVGFPKGQRHFGRPNMFALGGGVLAAALGKHNSPPCEPQRAKSLRHRRSARDVNRKNPLGIFRQRGRPAREGVPCFILAVHCPARLSSHGRVILQPLQIVISIKSVIQIITGIAVHQALKPCSLIC